MIRALAALALAVSTAGGEEAPKKVLLAPYSGIITPVAAEFMLGAVARAESSKYGLLVIELDTPGGLDPSMRDIVKGIMNSRVPVAVFVHPTGGRAASAGVFITMAAHVAAMAPGTNIGAAHPVQIGGGSDGGKGKGDRQEGILAEKAANDAAAYLRSIAQERGRNDDWAVEAVSKSTSLPASEALARRVVDVIAKDTGDLLRKIDGRTIKGFSPALAVKGAVLDRYEMTRRQRWLAAICDPNVAMILMSLGAAGLFIELYSPGLILPGIVGAVSLLLAFYSFQTLSASYAGVLLIVAGLLFLLLEIKVTSYGMLALGGIASFLLGALMLFQHHPLGGLSVSWSVLAGTLGGISVAAIAISIFVMKQQVRPVETGLEGMQGAEGISLEGLSPLGKVRIGAEIWNAESVDGFVEGNAAVVVTGVAGMRLKVRRKK